MNIHDIHTRAQAYALMRHNHRLLQTRNPPNRVRLLQQLHQLQSLIPLLDE
jgi:hypothetical protein